MNLAYVKVESQGYAWDTDLLDWVKVTAGTGSVGTEVEVTNFPTSQAVTGAFYPATQPVSAVSLPLPTNAASETGGNLATTVTRLTSILAQLDVALSTRTKPADQQHAIIDSITAGATVIGKVGIDQTTPGTTNLVQANAGTNLNTSALALEAGNLASIKAKTDNIPALGQALAAASTPVVLPAAQVTTLTPPAAIVGFALDATLLALHAALGIAQGATATDQVGPLVQGLVAESPKTFETETVQPLSLTSQGRLRVSAVDADVNQVWQHTQDSPWSSENPWEMEIAYV